MWTMELVTSGQRQGLLGDERAHFQLVELGIAAGLTLPSPSALEWADAALWQQK